MTTSEQRAVVLLVDADEERATRERETIEEAIPRGTAVRTATTTDALSMVTDDTVECVVVAWPLADDGDTSFLAALRELRPSLPVVLRTDRSLTAVSAVVEAYDVADVRPHTPTDLAGRLLGRSVSRLVDGNGDGDGDGDRDGDGDGRTDGTEWTDTPQTPRPGESARGGTTGAHDGDGHAGDAGTRARLGRSWEADTADANPLVDQDIAGIYVVEDRAFRYVNAQMAELFGTTPESMEGRPVLSFVAPEDHLVVRRNLDAQRDGDRESVHYVFTGRRVDGDRVELETSERWVETSRGGAIVGVLVDVTGRGRRERQLRHLSRAVEHAALAIYVTDADGRITYVNPAFEATTGYSAEAVVGEDPAVLNSGRMDDTYYDEMYDTINGGGVWQETIVDRRANGELYHARQTIAPVYDDERRIEGFVAIQEDVTEERIRQQVLQVLHRVLRHNLRNELNVIAGHAEVLVETLADGDDAVESAEAIRRATAELTELSDQATAAEVALDRDGTNSGAVDVVSLLRTQWKHITDGREMHLRLDGPEVAWVVADATLGIGVRELLRVAAGAEGGEDDTSGAHGGLDTVVSVRHVGDEVELEARIDNASADEWEPVQSGSETPLSHASGLDPWLIKWVVTRLGGDLDLSEETSLLTVRLPRASLDGTETL